MAWEEKCIGCLCNSCFYKYTCCGKPGSTCRKKKKCREYDNYISVPDDEETEEE